MIIKKQNNTLEKNISFKNYLSINILSIDKNTQLFILYS